MRKIRSTLFIVFFIVCLTGFSQEYNFEHITRQKGLPASKVYQAMQDGEGFMWFCTENGLCRYDGKELKIYKGDNQNSDYRSFHMEKDDMGRVWFVTFDDKLFYYSDSKINPPEFASTIQNSKICWLTIEQETFWFGTRNGLFCKFSSRKLDQYSVGNSPVSNFCRINDQYFILYCNNDILIFNTQTHQSKILPIKNDRRITAFPRFLKLRNGGVIICSSEGLLKINEHDLTISQVMPSGNSPLKWEVRGLLEDKEGGIWIGTQNGAFCFKNGIIKTNNIVQYLKNESVLSITQDHEGNYWFATTNGVFYLKNKDFIHYSHRTGKAPLLFIFPDKENFSLLSDDGTLLRLKNNNLEIVDDLNLGNSYAPSFYHYLYDSSILISSPHGNFNFKNGTIKPSIRKNYDLAHSHGHVWHYTFDEGIGYKKKNGEDTIIDNSISRNDPSFHFYIKDHKENLWFGSKHGLYVFDGTKIHYMGERNDLYKQGVTDIKQQKNGTIWVATETKGIYSPVGKPAVFNSLNGLSSNHCKSVFIDGQDNIWVATAEGADKLKIDGNKILVKADHINSSNGLITDEVNAIYKISNRVYIASPNGLTVFDDSDSGWKIPPPYINITNAVIDNNDIKQTGKIKQVDDDIQFTFSLISFCSGEKLLYKYKLLPLDKTWQTTTQNNIRFSNLNPGKYTFTVSGINASGEWSKIPSEYAFTIKPQFWQTWWYKVLITSAFIVLLILIAKNRINNINKKAQWEKRLIQTELRALQSQMNPHFIFNSLNSIQDFILDHKPEAANYYLAKFATLMRMIIDYSSKDSITLTQEIEFLNLYIELEKLRFSSGVKFTITNNVKATDHIKISSMMIQPIVENAIKHGLNSGSSNGAIDIRISESGNYIQFEIEDNGPGITSKNKSNHNSEHKSIGLKNIIERMELFGYKTQGGITIENLYNPDGTIAGTKATLNLPVLN